MANDIHFPSRMVTLAGVLMTFAGILMALTGRLAIGGVNWAAAACQFLLAHHLRAAENQHEKEKDQSNEQETV